MGASCERMVSSPPRRYYIVYAEKCQQVLYVVVVDTIGIEDRAMCVL